MAVTGRTYAQEFAANGAVVTYNGTDYIRVGERVITLTNFISRLIALGGIHSGEVVQAAADGDAAVIARSFDATPAEHPLRAELGDGLGGVSAYLGGIGTAPDSTAIGYVHARNVFPVRVFVTTDQTEPSGIVAGNFWLRPAV